MIVWEWLPVVSWEVSKAWGTRVLEFSSSDLEEERQDTVPEGWFLKSPLFN